MLEELIVGGGIAGLSCANRLAEMGRSPLLLDGGSFPCHKVCGEFFSHDCHRILREWNLLPKSLIFTILFHTKIRSYRFMLPMPACGESRFQFDQRLVERAIQKGAKVTTNAKVTKISYLNQETYPYRIYLEEGKTLASRKLFVAAGRIAHLLFNSPPQEMKYQGIKGHFEGISLDNTIHMFQLSEGYLGVSPIEHGKINVAGLFRKSAVQKIGGLESFLEKCFIESPGDKLKKLLSQGKPLFPNWMMTEIPEFSKSQGEEDTFKNLFLIGDAKATIPPISGAGLGMAVTSGWMAADQSLHGNGQNYQASWLRHYNTRLKWASVLHQLMLHPFFGEIALRASVFYPSLFKLLYRKTRGQ